MPELVFSNYIDKKQEILFILDVQSYMCWQKFNPFILARKRVPVMFSWKNHVPTSLSCFLIILSVLKTLELIFYTYVDKNINYFIVQDVPNHMCWQKPSFWQKTTFHDEFCRNGSWYFAMHLDVQNRLFVIHILMWIKNNCKFCWSLF